MTALSEIKFLVEINIFSSLQNIARICVFNSTTYWAEISLQAFNMKYYSDQFDKYNNQQTYSLKFPTYQNNNTPKTLLVLVSVLWNFKHPKSHSWSCREAAEHIIQSFHENCNQRNSTPSSYKLETSMPQV